MEGLKFIGIIFVDYFIQIIFASGTLLPELDKFIIQLKQFIAEAIRMN